MLQANPEIEHIVSEAMATAKEYKQHKGLKKENLRDNMTNTELV